MPSSANCPYSGRSTLRERLALPEQQGGVRAQAATAGARATCDRPPEMTHLPGITVFLDERRRRDLAGSAHGAWRPPLPKLRVLYQGYLYEEYPTEMATGRWQRT